MNGWLCFPFTLTASWLGSIPCFRLDHLFMLIGCSHAGECLLCVVLQHKTPQDFVKKKIFNEKIVMKCTCCSVFCTVLSISWWYFACLLTFTLAQVQVLRDGIRSNHPIMHLAEPTPYTWGKPLDWNSCQNESLVSTEGWERVWLDAFCSLQHQEKKAMKFWFSIFRLSHCILTEVQVG